MSKLQQLAKARARVQRLERSFAKELQRELAALPARYGFSRVTAFIEAVKDAQERGSGRTGRKRRGRINAAVRSKVKAMVQNGITGVAIAQKLRISPASVQNIKSALGLTRRRR